MFESGNVKAIAGEYKALLARFGAAAGTTLSAPGDRAVEGILVSQAEWTSRGAAEVVRLAREYGVFVLRNALALAIALDVQDGDLGI